MNLKRQKITCLKYSGFTLVEILVGITLLGFILVLLFSSLHTAGKSWAAGEQSTERTDELRLASQFIRQYLSQTVPLIWINKEERRIAFKGESNEVHFISTLPSHRGGGGLYLLSLSVDKQNGQQNLILRYRLASPERQTFAISDSDSPETTVLIEDIDQIEFSYFGRVKLDEDPQWHETWEIPDQLPTLISIKLSPSHPHYWPEIAIAIRPQSVNGQPQFFQFAGHDEGTL